MSDHQSGASAMRRVRHKKRGSTYKVIGYAALQTSQPLADMQGVVVYQGEADSHFWVRPCTEFDDGRFEDLPADPASSEGVEARTAPVQRYPKRIPWEVHLKAYEAYAREYGHSQSAERLAERGGFGVGEMDMYYPSWRDHVEELPRLRATVTARDAEIATLRAALEFYAAHWQTLPDDLLADEGARAREALAAIKQAGGK